MPDSSAALSLPRDRSVGVGALDPYEDISAQADISVSKQHHEGEHHEAFIQSFRDGKWGVSPRGCGSRTLVRYTETGVRLAPMFCDKWECPSCGPRLAAWLKLHLNEQVESGRLTSFWTLTIRTSACSAAESYPYITSSWNRLRRRISRVFPDFEYCWTREATKAGYAHLHLLTNKSLCEHCIGQEWYECTGTSWVTDVEPIQSSRAADYLSKYCVEQALDRTAIKLAKGSKPNTYGASEGVRWGPFRQRGTGEWTKLSKMPYWTARNLWAQKQRVQLEKSFGCPFVEFQVSNPEGTWPESQWMPLQQSVSSYERETAARRPGER